jgi:hypothetical protein
MATPLPSLLRGWRSLPDELKLLVLEHAIRPGNTLNHRHFERKTGFADLTSEQVVFNQYILPYLMCAEICGLTEQVIYSMNALIQEGGRWHHSDDSPHFRLPPRHVRKYIRHYRMQGNYMFQSYVKRLKDFAQNEGLLFPQLQILENSITGRDLSRKAMRAPVHEMIDASGTLQSDTEHLRIYSHPARLYHHDGPLLPLLRRRDSLEEGFLERLTITGPGIKVKPRYEHPKIPAEDGETKAGRKVQAVVEWPKAEVENGQYDRRTVKTVWLA